MEQQPPVAHNNTVTIQLTEMDRVNTQWCLQDLYKVEPMTEFTRVQVNP